MFTLREALIRYKTVLLLLLALQLVRGLVYSAVVPPWQGPDEPWHYEYVRLFSQGGAAQESRSNSKPSLSAEMEGSLRTFSLWRFHGTDTPPPGQLSDYSLWHASLLTPPAGHPPLHPMLLTPFYALASPLDIASRLFLLRLTSVLLGMGTVFLAFLTAAVLFPNEEALIIGIPAFIVFLPMHTFMTSMVNSDNLAELWASLAIFLMLTWFRDGVSPWRMLGAALAIVLGVLTKRTDIFLIPVFLVAVALYAGRWIPQERKRWAILLATLVSLVALAFLGIFIVYLRPRLQGRIIAYFVPQSLNSQVFVTVTQQEDFFHILFRVVQMSFVTFWAAFGWGNVTLAWDWYKVPAVICLAVVIGLVLYLLRFYRGGAAVEKWRVEATTFLLIALLPAILMGLAAMIFLGDRYRIGLHARYFFPAIIPIATFFLLGWRELFPLKYRRFAVPTCLAGLVLLDAMAMACCIIPFYYS
jgi:4-amino-4-deoxy-L-arabinose transferase-like glycosyltransferase